MSLNNRDDVLAGFDDLMAVQQRHVRRRRCSYGVLCQTPEIDFPATVVDLSLEGMRLEGANRVKPGSTLILRLNGGPRAVKETVRTVVRWCRKKVTSDRIQLGGHRPAALLGEAVADGGRL
ncbi:MAG: PilZ domain-containing protein [Candidatus Xenobia bacterium]